MLTITSLFLLRIGTRIILSVVLVFGLSLLIVVGSLLRGYCKNKKLVNKADTDNNE
ncbi:MAG TPA: hypothetical protein PK465_01605 [Saccharofermentans sp.]|nr:hypothetical protein [Saccharofermentans sp.]HPJ80883.1 hypothetical protein [Saccharofermentans sp.]HPQ31717.1 hypothetical protein [Saccharofermentans sp.]HRV50082.1 hypothetical protein [Saccharofermentans sp.]